jgi:hypothetical protein
VCATLWVIPSYRMPRAKEWFTFEETMKRERHRGAMRAEGLLGEEKGGEGGGGGGRGRGGAGAAGGLKKKNSTSRVGAGGEL